jgi:hypothetical protein
LNDTLPGIPRIESPLFPAWIETGDLSPDEKRLANDLNENGFAVFDFPDEDLDGRIDRIKANLGPRYNIDLSNPASDKTIGKRRLQDAWQYDEDVRAIARNPALLALLSKLYGRQAFPFQTLNFPVGTQQDAHSDIVHFSSLPARFMCGVWVAMEDITADAGPLFYHRGSHRWPIMNNALIGRRGYGSDLSSAQDPFNAAWREIIAAKGSQPETFLARKGQALIWVANLLHGGSLQADATKTRWSQVTHYYFDDCIYYTPAFSDEDIGKLHLRHITAINDKAPRKNVYLDEVFVGQQELPVPPRRGGPKRFLRKVVKSLRGTSA